MKKLVSILLLLTVVISFTACNRKEAKEISCEEIIAAYENAGYSALYHDHESDTAYNEEGIYCAFEIRDPNDEDNYMYIHRCFSEEKAKSLAKERKFNVVLWLFFGIFGEWRWLHVGSYGDIEYETFGYKMLKPLRELTK